MKATGLSATIFLKKETPTYVFSCEFCEIFKNTFFYRTPPVDASEYTILSGGALTTGNVSKKNASGIWTKLICYSNIYKKHLRRSTLQQKLKVESLR